MACLISNCQPASYSERLKPVFRSGKHLSWIDAGNFSPSSNLAPTMNILVLYLDGSSNEEILIRPMLWGIHSSNPWNSKGKSRLLFNVRTETLLKNEIYLPLRDRKKCCAIVCDGFYEWNNKHPYFFYNAQTEFDASVITPKWKENDWIAKGPPVMLLAGIYSMNIVKGEEVYSCSIITRDASTKTAHIHDRSAITLCTEEDVFGWLNPGGSISEQCVRTLLAMKNDSLSFYEVRDQVNSSRYQGPDCHLPLSCFSSSSGLSQWLSKSQPQDSKCSSHEQLNVKEPSSSKRKYSSDSPSKKKSLITDWFKRTPPNP